MLDIGLEFSLVSLAHREDQYKLQPLADAS